MITCKLPRDFFYSFLNIDFNLFQMASRLIAASLESTVKLNDGVVMPLFGLGVYKIENNCISSWKGIE
jgi:hypothetical protein